MAQSVCNWKFAILYRNPSFCLAKQQAQFVYIIFIHSIKQYAISDFPSGGGDDARKPNESHFGFAQTFREHQVQSPLQSFECLLSLLLS